MSVNHRAMINIPGSQTISQFDLHWVPHNTALCLTWLHQLNKHSLKEKYNKDLFHLIYLIYRVR